MFKLFKHSFLSLLLLLSLVNCSNAFRDFPNKSSDQYYIDEAQKFFDDYKFTQAIERIEHVLPTHAQDPQVVRIAALSYAGRAGLRALDMMMELLEINNTTFFKIFAEHFPLSDLNTVSDILKAVEILENYENRPTHRTSEFNMIAVFLYFSVVGVHLNAYAYTSSNVPDAAFDACNVTHLPHSQNAMIVRSFSKAMESVAYMPNQDFLGDTITDLFAIPMLAPFMNAQNAQCPDESVACEGMRSVINEGTAKIGIGSGVATPCVP